MRADAMLGFVRRLLTHEAAGSQDQALLIDAAERVADKLRAHLSTRIGQEGYRTLLARALALSTPLFPHLSAVRVGTDGSLSGLRVAAAAPAVAQDDGTRGDAVAGAVALFGQLLALLVTFIGEDLTLHMLGAVWPGFASDTAGWEKERS